MRDHAGPCGPMRDHAGPPLTISLILAQAGAFSGALGDATPFNGRTVEEIADELEMHGAHRYGDEVMYNPRTGEQVPCAIFICPTYYQRLKHMVEDKVITFFSSRRGGEGAGPLWGGPVPRSPAGGQKLNQNAGGESGPPWHHMASHGITWRRMAAACPLDLHATPWTPARGISGASRGASRGHIGGISGDLGDLGDLGASRVGVQGRSPCFG